MDEREKLRWNVRRRLQLIELRLFWEGKINRGDLVDFFGISVPQASQDLALYQSLAPGNLVYDKTNRTYVVGRDFSPVLSEPSAQAYLAQLRSLAIGALESNESWIGNPPPFSGAPRIRRTYDLETLRRLVLAIRRRLAMKVRYASFSEDSPPSRVIVPHALGFDGQRWHVRAFCHRSESFRDFVISRLSHVTLADRSTIDHAWDLEWTREVTLLLKANPRLPDRIKEVIERDHQMRDGELHVKTSICSSYYLESQLDLDIDPATLPPQRLQLVLANRQEVHEARELAKKETSKLIQERLGAVAAADL